MGAGFAALWTRLLGRPLSTLYRLNERQPENSHELGVRAPSLPARVDHPRR